MEIYGFDRVWRLVMASMVIGLLIGRPLDAQSLSVESCYPTMGELGTKLEVELKGTGFDLNTRLSMYPDTGNKKAILGSVDTPGSANDVVVVDNIAYVADGSSGLQIIDVSNPESPEIIGSVDTPGYANGVTVENGIAYVADRYSGLQVIDVSDPSEPNIIGSVDTPHEACAVTVAANIAYVSDFYSGLQVIDVSNPSAPKIIGSVDTPGWAWGVAVAGRVAYVADRDSGLQVIDVSDPSEPNIIGSVDTPDSAYDVSVSCGFAYVASNYSGLQVIDVSNPEIPEIVSSVETRAWAEGVTVAGDIAYVADYSGLQIINVSNPSIPENIGFVETPDDARAVTVEGAIAYVADRDSGLQIINVSNSSVPLIVGFTDTPCLATGIAVANDIAYVADYCSGLQVINVSNPSAPEIISSVETTGWTSVVTVADDIAYVDDHDIGLLVIDISEPSSPEIAGSVETLEPLYVESVTVAGEIVYVADHFSGLKVIKVSDPSAPEVIGFLDTLSEVHDVTVLDGIAYIAVDSGGLQVVDVSNPIEPMTIGAVSTPDRAFGVTVTNGIAYIADWDSGLQVIDVGNPKAPKIIGSVDTPDHAKRVNVVDDIAYIFEWYNKFQMIDVSNPTQPVIIGYIDTPGDACEVEIVGDKAYVADGYAGLTIVPLPVEVTDFRVNSDTSITARLPSPQLVGNYTIRVFNDHEYDELLGAVTYRKQLPQSKAIIVAGGGPSTPNWNNNLWPRTKTCTDYAYRALLYQGYRREDIQYLSHEPLRDVDGDGELNDIDDIASKTNLYNAINTWAADASDLIIYLTDHGGPGIFRMASTELLTAEDFDMWLDNLQSAMPGRLTIIYDACHSGTFLDKLSPPPNKQRILITSASDEPALFLKEGKHSFSFQFWADIYNGSWLLTAFYFGQDMMEKYQTALIDANGNGIGNEKEDKLLANGIRIGRGYVPASDMPVIADVSEPQELNGETSAVIQANGVIDSDGIQSVWMVITPPGFNPGSPDTPITDLPTVELTDDNADGTYEATYDGFDRKGTYQITVYAADTLDTFSLPRYTSVVQNEGIFAIGDVSGDGVADLKDAIIALKIVSGIDTSFRWDYTDSGVDIDDDNRIGLQEAIYALRNAANINK